MGLAQEALGSRRYSVLTGYKFRGQQWCRHETAQGRMLGLAGIPMKKVHRLADHEWAQVADLVVISPLNNFRPPAHEIFAQEEMFRFLARIGEKSRASGKGKRIYCSRRDTTNRMMENEAELIEAVAKQFGFVEVQLGEHSVDEQIAIFREAEIAIGPIGNAFMNMAYMGPDARIVTFLPPETWHFLPYYQSFATAGGFDVHAVIGETSHSEGADLNALRWRVDIDAACKNVDAIIQQGDQRQSLLERLMTWMTRRATSNTKDNT
ncbi:glycosyltransferase family 61 protein [Rhodobacteraceae bacterium 63075]|nr:glycosyltransferase family 61 protein [Rhodobacteraceae bacterium 63075]